MSVVRAHPGEPNTKAFMILTELPNHPKAKDLFTVGNDYEVLREIGGNPVVLNNEGDECLISSTRFEPVVE